MNSPMTKTIVNPSTLAKPSGYSNGILIQGGRVLFIAGQTGMHANGIIAAPDDIVAQFRQALTNIREVVHDAGGQMTDIIKMTIFVTDKNEYRAATQTIGQVHREFFGRYYPAMTLVQIGSLWDDSAKLEIESIAVLD
jgi:enamine deaminase RidA (YjgF/YER057c/UK114 family)